MLDKEKSPRILFVHPDLYAFGGAEQVCVRMIAAAQRLGEVYLLHFGGPLDCHRIRAWSGIAIDPLRVRFIVPRLWTSMLKCSSRMPIMKFALALRYARRLAADFDLVVSTYGECPLDTSAGVQFFHFPVFCPDPRLMRYLNIDHASPSHSMIRGRYVRFCRWLSGYDYQQVRSKTTIANSAWTAQIVRQVYAIRSFVAPPGAAMELKPGGQSWVDWPNRTMGFVMLGRIHPSKRLELGIEIVRRIRSRGYGVELHIAGGGGDGYVEQLQRRTADMPWIHLHLDLPRTELERLVVRHKFGLHACQFEHYGIAAMEMQALGCLVFVPDFAGQREVVTNPAQRWSDVDDAVLKIVDLLRQPAVCQSLAANTQANFTGAPDFVDRVGDIFVHALSGAAALPPAETC